MEDWAITNVQWLTHAIETIAKIVIPFEAIVLVCLRRRLFEGDALVNVLVGSVLGSFMLFGHWNIPWVSLAAVRAYAPFQFEITAPVIIAHILVGDLCFYVFHRLAHTRVFFLLDHSVHHSSRQLNFSTNLRISLVSILYAWTPMIIPVLLGFHPGLLIACFALANAVPFFMHNHYVGKLGWLEYVFNTPSHHRVHHGINGCYINKNFAGIFIFWDKIFGTYAEEVEPVRYGVAGMETTQNPIKVITRGWLLLAQSILPKSRKVGL